MLGRGRCEKEPDDDSLAAFASMLRDLLVALGHERATVVGQSLGGGIAMQLAYRFPERCPRLVPVGSGGLGREIDPILRLLHLAAEMSTRMIWGDSDPIISITHVCCYSTTSLPVSSLADPESVTTYAYSPGTKLQSVAKPPDGTRGA